MFFHFITYEVCLQFWLLHLVIRCDKMKVNYIFRCIFFLLLFKLHFISTIKTTRNQNAECFRSNLSLVSDWYDVAVFCPSTFLNIFCVCVRLSLATYSCDLVPPYVITEPATERRGHEMPTLWCRSPEERWLWLDLLFDVQDRNLLGDQTGTLGPKCNVTSFTPLFRGLERLASAFELEIWLFYLFVLCRAGATHLGAADAASITSRAIPTAKTATDATQLITHVPTHVHMFTIWKYTELLPGDGCEELNMSPFL